MCKLILPIICAGFALLFGLVALTALGCFDRFSIPPKPALPATVNWGLPSADLNDKSIVSANITVSEATLTDLKSRLRAFKWVEPLEGATFDYGFNGDFMRELVAYWLEKYDWRHWERLINSYGSHYTPIEGLRLHFLHAKPSKPAKKILPMLLLHGWPGSLFEFYKLIPLLTTPDADGLAFEVVVPSIPGFAWSEAPRKPGFNEMACARIYVKLMERLGFSKFYLHGGDWGSITGHVMDVEYEDRLLGFHTNMPMQSFRHPSSLVQTILGAFLPVGWLFDQRDCDKLYPYFGKMAYLFRETGYMHLQATRPDTVGHILSDSPVGLAAYIVEKFSVWTRPENIQQPNGNLVGPKADFTLDELLTNVMIYWTSGSITSSLRLYKEMFGEGMDFAAIPSRVPYGVASFKYELAHFPERYSRLTHPNLLRYTDFETGGHFAALQLSDLMYVEIREFVRLAEAFHAENLAREQEKTEL